MKTVIIVSKCLRVTKFSASLNACEFHFKGVFAGQYIQKVILQSEGSLGIRKGEEYLMYVQLQTFTNGVLQGRLLKAKVLDECWDRS